VDKKVVINAIARGKLVEELSYLTPWQAKPAKRVYIPKNNGKYRPLGIPVIKDRCLQAMVKNALEPYWEARFEGISYGFRPGRSCQDAMQKIYHFAQSGSRKEWVIDADISQAFDTIDHAYLLKAIGQFPARELIKQWLKAGYVDRGVFVETTTGTPQGGVISPLLANIALHGMEEALKVYKRLPNGTDIVTTQGVKYDKQGLSVGQLAVVRYADDFVVFCESRERAEEVLEILKNWLYDRGLRLSTEKTRIVHLSEGFDFLGFTVRRYKRPRSTRTGWKLLITPSKASVRRLRERLRQEWYGLKGRNVATVLRRLNPIIRGWAQYYRGMASSKAFVKLDHWMCHKELRYAKSQHSNKRTWWLRARYFGRLNPGRNDQWVFGNKDTGEYLQKFSWFKIQRHILVRGTASPDDARLREYWQKRGKAQAKNLPANRERVAVRQQGKCQRCGASLFNGETVHLHHKIWKSRGGTDDSSNLELVHLICHQQIHVQAA
jgi:RNA-directed DNA polymerase